MLTDFLRYITKVRAGVETAYSATYPNMRVGYYLWHTHQSHRFMDEFKDAYFHKYPNIKPSIVNHIFKHHIPKVDVEIKKPKSMNIKIYCVNRLGNLNLAPHRIHGDWVRGVPHPKKYNQGQV